MQQLILGTAQLGIDYGINNNEGKPDRSEAFKILDYAYNNGIKIIDTASSYGDSEEIIGDYMEQSGNKFKIATKFLGDKDELQEKLKSSIINLKVDSIDIYFIHHFEDLDEQLILDLKMLKNDNQIKKIGISIYEPSELEYILENLVDVVDVVQVPFNLFDYRWVESNIFKRAKEKNISLFVRSVFLQGLFFMEDQEKMDEIDSSLKYYNNKIRELSSNNNLQISQLAMDYVKSYEEIDGILIGCENINQLEENIGLFKQENNVDKKLKKEIHDISYNISKKIIDPREW